MNGKLIKKLPNVLTLCNMAIGLSVTYMMISSGTEDLRRLAGFLILTGAAVDMADGWFARRFDAVTDIGKQLDSFADLVTFGIAPLTIFYNLAQGFISPVAFAVFAVFPLAAAFRLARYNLGEYSDCFEGLPTTAAGSILALGYLIYSFLGVGADLAWFLVFIQVLVLLLSVLMVSRVRVSRIKIKGNWIEKG